MLTYSYKNQVFNMERSIFSSLPIRGTSKVFFVGILCLTICKTGSTVANGIDIKREKDYNNLDYVSLTDNDHRSKFSDYNYKDGNKTWIIGKASCSHLQPGCNCNTMTGSETSNVKTPIIVCSCSDAYQVVTLKGHENRDHEGKESTRWRIQGCSKVIVQNNFLSAFFEAGKDLFLEFNNISSLIIHESAFTLKEQGSSFHNATIVFNNCIIKNVPPLAFPSYLSTIKFVNCKIGTLSSTFIQSLRMGKIIFEKTSVDDIQSDAFYSNTIIDSLIAKDSLFKRVHPNALASAIQHLSWSDCVIDRVSKHGIIGLIASVVIERCLINYIGMQGFSVKSWTMISLENNTFENVSHLGIDLAHPEILGPAVLIGNTWKYVEKDFIFTGVSEKPFAIVKNNTFLTICSCGATFTSFLTLNGSRSWFHDELFQSSRCLLDEKAKMCLNSANRSEEAFVTYQDLSLLCSPEMFMCASEVQDVPVKPHFPNRLLIAAFLIGAFVLFMIVSLLLTMLVYMIRRKSPGKIDMHGNGTEPANDLPHKEFLRSINSEQYAAINSRIPKTPSMPTRLGIFEDVEMEDKGIQTMPTELSADIIEGLREKLTKPDSFWDAKETIDHLYDLIHVHEQSVVTSSPPDVTVRNDQATNISGTHISHDSLKRLISPSRKVPSIITADRPSRRSISGSVQIPSPTRNAQICEYRDPSDSKIHIYSELNPSRNEASKEISNLTNLNERTQPNICDYTEPSDFQTHIYAELSNIMQAHPKSQSPTTTSQTQTGLTSVLSVGTDHKNDFSLPSMPSPVIPSTSQNKISSLSSINDLNQELPSINFSTFPKRDSSINAGSSMVASDANLPTTGSTGTITNPSHMQRPLPSIPFPSISTVQ